MRGGVLMAVPFRNTAASKTGSHRPVRQRFGDTPFGNFNPVLNGGGGVRRSEYRRSYRHAPGQSAGGGAKALVPYSATASRNRMPVRHQRYASPFSTTLKLGHGVAAVSTSRAPYGTTSKMAQAALRRPMHTRVGFTNSAIMAAQQRRLRANSQR